MFDKIAQKRGYVKRSDVRHLDLTDEEISYLLNKAYREIEVPKDFDKEEEKRLFQSLSNVEGFHEYLEQTLGLDKNRYFQANTAVSQLEIRGSYRRTQYFKSMLTQEAK